MSVRVFVPVGLFVVLASTGTGRGYVQTTSDKSGVPVRWLERCITVRPDAHGSQDISADDVASTLARAVSNWQSRTVPCSYLVMNVGAASTGGGFGIDGRPTVVFRDVRWSDARGNPRDPGIIALTTVFYVDTPGLVGDATILDADVELNGVDYTFALDAASAVPRGGTQIADLENTLTHELGHVQGLGHTCWDHVRETPPLDNRGQPIPDCGGTLPESILETTMYPYPLTPGETSKRHLSQDDVDGICVPYPVTDPAPPCQQEVDGGCSVAGGGAAGAWPLLLLFLVRRRA